MGGKLGTQASEKSFNEGVRRSTKMSSRHDWVPPVSRLQRAGVATSANPLFDDHEFEIVDYANLRKGQSAAPIVRELREDRRTLIDLLYTYYFEQDYERLMDGSIDVDAVVDSIFRKGLAEIDAELVLRYGVSVYKYIQPSKHQMKRVSTNVPVYNLNRDASQGKGGVLERWGLSSAEAQRTHRRLSSYDRLPLDHASKAAPKRPRSRSTPKRRPSTKPLARAVVSDNKKTSSDGEDAKTSLKAEGEEGEVHSIQAELDKFFLAHDPDAMWNGRRNTMLTYALSFGVGELDGKLKEQYNVGLRRSSPIDDKSSQSQVPVVVPPVDKPSSWAVHPDDIIPDETYSDIRREQLNGLLNSFFFSHDQKKVLEGTILVHQVVEWTLVYGVPALNSRLEHYYGTSLSSLQPHKEPTRPIRYSSASSLSLSPEELVQAEHQMVRLASNPRLQRFLTVDSTQSSRRASATSGKFHQAATNEVPRDQARNAEEKRIRETHARVHARLARLGGGLKMVRTRSSAQQSTLRPPSHNSEQHSATSETGSVRSSWSRSKKDQRSEEAKKAGEALARELAENVRANRSRPVMPAKGPSGFLNKSGKSSKSGALRTKTPSRRLVGGRHGAQVTSKGTKSKFLSSHDMLGDEDSDRPRPPPPGAPLRLRQQHAMLVAKRSLPLKGKNPYFTGQASAERPRGSARSSRSHGLGSPDRGSSSIRHKLSYILKRFETASGKFHLEKLFDPALPTPENSVSSNSPETESTFPSSASGYFRLDSHDSVSSEKEIAVTELLKVI